MRDAHTKNTIFFADFLFLLISRYKHYCYVLIIPFNLFSLGPLIHRSIDPFNNSIIDAHRASNSHREFRFIPINKKVSK